MVTIKDIAKESGYSVSTVSRVLNNRRDVSPDAKKKIEEVVAAHHFIPNNNAKHLKQTISKTIIILVKGTSNMLFADIVENIQQMLGNTKYTSVVSYIDEDANEVQQAIQMCRERKPLGLMFLGGNIEYFKESFDQIEIPSVLVTNRGSQLHFPNLSSVATDDVAAAKCAIDFLFDKGHTKIAVLGGDLELSYTSHQRMKGCLQSFFEHGIEFDRDCYYEKARFSFQSAYHAMERLMNHKAGVTAVFAMSDVMAIGAIRALIDRGFKVPEDVSVIGFDGTRLAEFYNPKLSTIKQQYQILASRSVEILFHLIDLNASSEHEVVPFEFVAGESVKQI